MAALAILLVAFGGMMISAGEAWGIDGHAPGVDLEFMAGRVILQIPTPACTGKNPNCVWALYVNEPKLPGHPFVAEVNGTSGTLAVQLPDFCGVIQADALVGPRPWHQKGGVRETLETCGATTTTGGASSTTSSSTSTSTSTSTTTTVAPKVAAVSTTPSTNALPYTSPTTAAANPAVVAVADDSKSPPELPFTGANFTPLVILGGAMTILGALLISTVESRRRLLRRAAAIRVDDVKEGARKTSSWFLGL
jgi:hypothetical protein